jgi:hypothetical protein
MDWFFGFAVIGGMILLRIAVPILIMGLLIWGLRRLNARWEAEAGAERQRQTTWQPSPSASPSTPVILERGRSASLPESG